MGWITDVGVGLGVAVEIGVGVTTLVLVGVGVTGDVPPFITSGRYNEAMSEGWALAIILPPPKTKITQTSKTPR